MHAKEAVWSVSLLCSFSTLIDLMLFPLRSLQLPRVRGRLLFPLLVYVSTWEEFRRIPRTMQNSLVSLDTSQRRHSA